MRWRILSMLFLLSTTAGCSSFYEDFLRNIVTIPIRKADDFKITLRCRHLACEAWKREVQGHPDRHYSSDYANGFKDGYAEYLDHGGNGQPPAVPPFCYRLSHYETPEGIQEVEQWYEGYRQGALTAQASGLRELMVIPLSAPPINVLTDQQTPGPSGSPPQQSSPPEQASPPSELPSPHPLKSVEVLPPPMVVLPPPSGPSS